MFAKNIHRGFDDNFSEDWRKAKKSFIYGGMSLGNSPVAMR